MTQEQARQEAERRVIRYYFLPRQQAIRCDLISINREIELYSELIKRYDVGVSAEGFVNSKLTDLNQMKDELLKM